MTGVEILTAVGAAIGGGGIVKLVEMYVNRKGTKFNEEKDLRAEFRADYKERIEDLEKDVLELKNELKSALTTATEWKTKYDSLYFEFKTFQVEMYQVLINNGIDAKTYIKDVIPLHEQ